MKENLNKKILITGATSFIGKYVLKYLIENTNAKLVATSIESKNDVVRYDWLKSVEYIQCDLYEPKKDFFDFFGHPDLMINLCWMGMTDFKNLVHIEKNLFGQYVFIVNMLRNGLKDLTISGTCFEYGKQEGCLSEEIATFPENPYSLAKDTLRRLMQELKKHYNFSYKWARLFYLYGEGQSRNSIFTLLNSALERGDKTFNMSKGEQIRDYLPVETAAKYLVKIALQREIEGVINCCSGKPVMLKEMVLDYLRMKGKTIELNLGYYPYLDHEPMAFWGNTTKLEKILKG